LAPSLNRTTPCFLAPLFWPAVSPSHIGFDVAMDGAKRYGVMLCT
jgi:hypothetical protein